MNSTAWQNARKKAGLLQVRVHDLKHTFGRRLRTAGVPLETRKVLLWHKTGPAFVVVGVMIVLSARRPSDASHAGRGESA